MKKILKLSVLLCLLTTTSHTQGMEYNEEQKQTNSSGQNINCDQEQKILSEKEQKAIILTTYTNYCKCVGEEPKDLKNCISFPLGDFHRLARGYIEQTLLHKDNNSQNFEKLMDLYEKNQINPIKIIESIEGFNMNKFIEVEKTINLINMMNSKKPTQIIISLLSPLNKRGAGEALKRIVNSLNNSNLIIDQVFEMDLNSPSNINANHLNQYDCINLPGVLGYIMPKDRSAVFQTLSKFLKKGGSLQLSVPGNPVSHRDKLFNQHANQDQFEEKGILHLSKEKHYYFELNDTISDNYNPGERIDPKKNNTKILTAIVQFYKKSGLNENEMVNEIYLALEQNITTAYHSSLHFNQKLFTNLLNDGTQSGFSNSNGIKKSKAFNSFESNVFKHILIKK